MRPEFKEYPVAKFHRKMRRCWTVVSRRRHHKPYGVSYDKDRRNGPTAAHTLHESCWERVA